MTSTAPAAQHPASPRLPERSLRSVVRGAAEVLGTSSGLTAFARSRARHHVAVLAWHNVVAPADAGRGDASLHLPLPAFIAQIERLMRTHDIVDLDASSDAGTVRIRNAGRRPRAAITFDDAYRGAVTLALPELIARGLPATVFAAPAMLGARGTWWDELAEAGLLTDAVRDAALRDHAGRGAEILRAVARDAEPPSLPESYGIASAAELARACGNAIRVGSHSWSHEYLPALSDAELKDNLARTLEWVGRFDGRTSRCLALPYGGGSPELGRIALRAGHTTVLRIEGGLWKRNAALAWVPRINVPAGLTGRGLELRASGLFGR